MEYVYLGNLVDDHLSLSSNFKRVYRKACGRLRLLALVRRILTINTAKLLYKMTILPILTYSSTVKTSFSSLHQLREGQVVLLASLLIESLKPSNITSQLWSANAYVKNLIITSWIIILKLKIMGRELEKMVWSVKCERYLLSVVKFYLHEFSYPILSGWFVMLSVILLRNLILYKFGSLLQNFKFIFRLLFNFRLFYWLFVLFLLFKHFNTMQDWHL